MTASARILLSRDAFREGVFRRDGYKCVVPGCGAKADDAHHIIERRLWPDEGYYLDNGASLCEPHHQFGAERCVLQPQVLRQWVHIKNVVIPSDWDSTKEYDKWGIAIKQPTRDRVKYPSTPYLPMSPGSEPNDINLVDVQPFLNTPLVITIKMDGSNSIVTRELVAARNGSHAEHPSFDLLKAEHAKFRTLIPDGVQVFGEWLYARHSIAYINELALASFFQVFGVYHQGTQIFGAWSDVEAMAKRIGFPTVPVLEAGVVYTEAWRLESRISKLAEKAIENGHEGLVVRTAYPFPYGSFEGYDTTNGKTRWHVAPIAKFVRPNHVQTDDHWSQQPLVRNDLGALKSRGARLEIEDDDK